MTTNELSDPLANPEIALRIALQRQRSAAIVVIIFGALWFLVGVFPLYGREPVVDRVNHLSTTVHAMAFAFFVFMVGLGIKTLMRPNPLVKLVLDLNERVKALESKENRTAVG